MQYVHGYTQFLNEQLIMEGGAFGHLHHPFEDHSLTFNDLSEMIELTVTGAFNQNNFVQEKTDGQNLMFTWKNGEIRGARSKKHLRNQGENSLSKQEISQMYSGRGEIFTAFTEAINDLESAIKSLSSKQKDRIFSEGSKFMSVEIITPMTQNTVPYGLSMLVFHGTNEYDIEGNVLNQDKTEAKILAGMIKQINQDVQNTFFIRGPQNINLEALPNTAKKKNYYQGKLRKLVNKYNLSMSDSIPDYLYKVWRDKTIDILSNKNYTEEIIDGLAMRWGKKQKSYSIPNIKKDLGPEFSDWVKNFEKRGGEYDKLWKEYIAPVEGLFLELGADILTNIESFLTADQRNATEEMRQEIESTIEKIRNSDDVTAIEKLEHQLQRIDTAGGLKRLVPSEGITFLYKGKLYKYTGLFAAINQIGSLIRYN